MTAAAPELLGDGWLEALTDALGGVEASAAVCGTAQFTVSGAPGGRTAAFHVTVASGRIRVTPGRLRGSDAVIAWKFADFAALWLGELSVEEAYMTGRMKIDGDRVLLIDGWQPLRMSEEIRAALKSLGAAV